MQDSIGMATHAVISKKYKAPQIAIFTAYLFAIALAEVVIAYFNPRIGLLLHTTIIFVLFGHSAFKKPTDKATSNLLISIGVAPLIRLISLSSPLLPFSYIQWFLIISIPLFISILFLAYLQGLGEKELGLSLNIRHLPVELAVALIGLPLGIIEYLVLKPNPLIHELSFQSVLGPALILLICTGFVEELIFRGMLQYNIIKIFGSGFGLIYTSLLFAILHIGNLSVLSVVFAFSAGYIFALVVKRTGSIIGVSIAHGLVNIMLFLILPVYL